MDRELVERSRQIDAAELGRRLRHARLLAGMTQAQVASSEVSAAYLSRIEDGQRRPEFDLLRRLVERMGTTLESILGTSTADEVLQFRVALDHAELKLSSGDAPGALASITEVIGQLPSSGPGSELRPPANRVRAGALEATGDLNAAIILLEDLTAIPQASPDWLRCLISLSRCYRDSGDLAKAIAVGERATEHIAELGLEGATEAIQLSVTVASAQISSGNLDQAMRICMRALDAAERFQSVGGMAAAYWNASVVETKRGQNGAALDLARKALLYFELGEDGRNLSRLRAQIATLQLRTDPPDPDGALETLERAGREMSWSAASDLDKAGALLTRARAHFLRDEPERAREYMRQCSDLTPESAVYIRSSIKALAGDMALAAGDTESAREQYLVAVATLTGMGADRDAAQLWFQLGTSLAGVGEPAAAIDALSRAGISNGLATSPIVKVQARPGR